MLVLLFVFYSAVIFHQLDGRKYDIKEECKKLYGEDLNKVLKRFKRTPEYLKILNTKMAEINSQSNDIYRHLLIHESKQLKKQIYDLFNVSTDTYKPGNGTRFLRELWQYPVNRHSNHYFGKFGHKVKNKREGETNPEEEKGRDVKNKENEEEETTTTISPIELLDNAYSSSLLTVDQRNLFKDLGYEAAGKLIHNIIGSFDDDYSLKSTRFAPEGKYNLKNTVVTEHVHVIHESTLTLHVKSTVTGDEGDQGLATRIRHHRSSEWLPQVHKNLAHRNPRIF